MKHSRKLFLFLIILFFVAEFFAQPVAAKSTLVLIPETHHDFGSIHQGEPVAHDFIIRNTGSTPLTVTFVGGYPPGLTVRFAEHIEPNETAKVQLTVDTERLTGELQGRISLQFNDPENTKITFTIAGTIIPDIAIRPRPIILLSLFQGETDERVLRIVNNQDVSLTVIEAISETQLLEPKIVSIQDGKEYELRIFVPDNIPAGKHDDIIVIKTDDREHPQLRVTVKLLVKAEIHISPPTVNFGKIDAVQFRSAPSIRNFTTQQILVTRKEGKMRITSIESDIPYLTIAQSPTGSAKIFHLQIGLDPNTLQTGPMDGAIRIGTDDAAFPELVVPIIGQVE